MDAAIVMKTLEEVESDLQEVISQAPSGMVRNRKYTITHDLRYAGVVLNVSHDPARDVGAPLCIAIRNNDLNLAVTYRCPLNEFIPTAEEAVEQYADKNYDTVQLKTTKAAQTHFQRILNARPGVETEIRYQLSQEPRWKDGLLTITCDENGVFSALAERDEYTGKSTPVDSSLLFFEAARLALQDLTVQEDV